MRVVLIGPHDASGKKLQKNILRLLNGMDVETITVEEFVASQPLVREISDAIESSDLIIADISEQNPNVLYELGFAHALRKPTILLKGSHSDANVPSDLAGTFYISYDLNDLSALESQLRHSVMSYMGWKKKVK